MMQRRHFEKIAEIIREMPTQFNTGSKFDRERVATHFAHKLKYTNMRFDVNRFVDACIPEEEGKV